MLIKFKNVLISDKKKNLIKNGVNFFFFKKFLYIIVIDGVKKKIYFLLKMFFYFLIFFSFFVIYSMVSRVKWMIIVICLNLNVCRFDVLLNYFNICN